MRGSPNLWNLLAFSPRLEATAGFSQNWHVMTEPTWTLSDGTVVRLGGRVDGEGRVVDLLRGDVRAIRRGERVPISMFVEPGGTVPLDLDSVPHVDCWVRDTARFGPATVASAPEFERPDDGRDFSKHEHVPGRVY
jgi:hypothetical protein